MECFPEKVPRATEGLEGTVVASWAAGDAAQGGGAEPLVWHAVSTSHHDRPPKKGLKDAGAHIGEGRTVLAVGGPPEHDPGAGR